MSSGSGAASGRKLIVGLGNPGPRYRNTRHNVGFMVLDEVASGLGVAFSREKFGGLFTEAPHAGRRLMLLKPLTFMNNSGTSVAQAAHNRIENIEDILVIVDDLDLPTGRVRLRMQGSSGGHNGLKSIIAHLGSDAFPRLRIGIGRNEPGAGAVDHVLGTFTPEEKPEIQQAVRRSAEAVLVFAAEGIEAAMNRFNTGSG